MFNLAKRKLRRDLLGTKNDLKDNYEDNRAKFCLIIADVIRRDSDHKLQNGRFQMDIKKKKIYQKGNATLEQMMQKLWNP